MYICFVWQQLCTVFSSSAGTGAAGVLSAVQLLAVLAQQRCTAEQLLLQPAALGSTAAHHGSHYCAKHSGHHRAAAS
jgi:hypothetical protein